MYVRVCVYIVDIHDVITLCLGNVGAIDSFLTVFFLVLVFYLGEGVGWVVSLIE